jgi:PAS domain S-box-containing protein
VAAGAVPSLHVRSLRSRLTLLVLVALAPGFAVLWSASWSDRAALVRSAEDDAAQLARRVADHLFHRAVEGHGFAPGELQASRVRGVPALGSGHPVTGDDGRPAGVVFAGVDAAHVGRQLAALALPADAVAYVTDRAGVILAGTGASPGDALPEAIRGPATGGAAVHELDGPDGTRRFYAFEPVPGRDGDAMVRVVVGIPSALAHAAADRMFRRTLLGHGLAGLLVCAAIAYGGPLLLTRRVEAIVGGRGDVGDQARTFDDMAASLDRLSRRHRLVLESAGDGILEVDRDRRITFANPASERLLGLPPGKALGRPVHDFIPDRTGGGCPACGAVESGEPRHAGDLKLVREDGSTFPADCTAAPVVDGGAILGAVVTLKDVREKRRLEDDLRQAQKMEAVGQLAGGIAHDFNNILTAILGAGQFAREALGEHAARADVEDILKAAKRGADLTRRLLSFSRRQVPELRVVEVRTVVSTVQELLKRLLPEAVSLGTRVAPERCLVRVDRGLLEQALVNLALNARDAMPKGGRLVLEARPIAPDAPGRAGDPGLPAGGLVMVAVKDTGVGMDEATRARIFEPFFTTKEAGKGTGLGLSTVYSAVRAAGGVVRVESARGTGTTFRLYLPRVLDDIAPTPPPPRRPRAGSERVLLVEDEVTIRALARRALEAGGYQVLEGDRPSTALRALEMSGTSRLDLLVTDVMLPEASGGELADQLAARFPGLRVLFMSGYTGGMLEASAMEAPGRAFLAKPFGPDALVAQVRELLDTPLPE